MEIIWPAGTPTVLMEAIEYECVRQHVDETRRPMLLAGWEFARAEAEADRGLTMASLMRLAVLVEPSNGGKPRSTPVTFAGGGYAAPPEVLATALSALVEAWPTPEDDRSYKAAWLKEFLVVHPLSDGNGRSAWVLQQWLFNTWAAPTRLIDFNF